jgi:signal peptidase I
MSGLSGRSAIGRYARYGLYFLILVVIIVAGYGAVYFATGESVPVTVVTGTSMQPTILAGSVAVLQKVPFDQLKVGDIIVFVPPLAQQTSCDAGPGPSLTGEAAVPCYVIHRIVGVVNTTGHYLGYAELDAGNCFQTMIVNHPSQLVLVTKGDNNCGSISNIDYPIDQSMYIGKVVLEIPVLGYATQRPYNELIAIFVLGLLLGEFYWERRSADKAEESKMSSWLDHSSRLFPTESQLRTMTNESLFIIR